MTDYRVESRTRAGAYVTDLPYRDLQYEIGINGPHDIRFNLPLVHDQVTQDTFAAGLHEVWVWRNDILVQAGPVWDIYSSSSESSLTVLASSLEDYLDTRLIDDAKFETMDQSYIAWELIDRSQALTGGNLYIESGDLDIGVSRTLEWKKYDCKYILEALQDISELDDGFDFRIDPATREFNTYYPRPQRDNGLVLSYPENIRRYSVAYMGKWHRNRVRIQGPDGHYSEAINTTGRTKYGLRDYVEPFKDVTTATELSAFAGHVRDMRSEIKRYPTLLLDVGDMDLMDDTIARLGDKVRVRIAHGYDSMNELMRYVGAQISVGKSGSEIFTMYTQDLRELV